MVSHPPSNPGKLNPYRPISSRYLSLIEREHIFDLRKAGHGVRAIARLLGRSASTISPELRRNHTAAGPYAPLAAQRKATARRLRPKQGVIAADGHLRAVIEEKMALRWSPQQISGWLRLHHPEKRGGTCVMKRSTRRCTSRPGAG